MGKKHVNGGFYSYIRRPSDVTLSELVDKLTNMQ